MKNVWKFLLPLALILIAILASGCAIKELRLNAFNSGNNASIERGYARTHVQTVDSMGNEVRTITQLTCSGDGSTFLSFLDEAGASVVWAGNLTKFAAKSGIQLESCGPRNNNPPPAETNRKIDGLILKCENEVLFIEQWKSSGLVWERPVRDLAAQQGIKLGACKTQ